MRLPTTSTTYAGVRFRSRLHATWAAFFDLVGWPWEYQADDFFGFVPTFRLDFHRPLYVVVQGEPQEGNEESVFGAAVALQVPRLLILGPAANWLGRDRSTIGILQSEDTSHYDPDDPRGPWVCRMSDYVEFARCTVCDRYTLFPEAQSFHCQVCDAYEGGNNRYLLPGLDLFFIWAKAQPGLVPLRAPSPRIAEYDPFEDEP